MMLEEYREKRNLERSGEPETGQAAAGAPLVFVVQKHAARNLHYDFRLELDGTLKSWSVPKGPSLNPDEKRLAVMVEDHPLDYRHFEGNIPAGEYGAGQVIVWDKGEYSPDENGELSFDDRQRAEQRVRKGLADGKLSILLRGNKLRGSWTLVKMQRREKDWLLIKHRDEYAGTSRDILAEGASAISGLTIKDIKAGHLPPPSKNREEEGSVAASFPKMLAPMLASSAQKPFSRSGWLFEPKLDGFRTLALIENGKVTLLSRNGLDVTGYYKSIEQDLRHQPASQVALDGEIIALDASGKICFECLQRYAKSATENKVEPVNPPAQVIYYVFDILYLDGFDLTGVELRRRKQVLKRVLKTSETVRPVEYFENDGETVFKAALKNGFEGIIAKQGESRYFPGERSDKWLKIKAVKSDEFIVGGYTRGSGRRQSSFGALLLGYYDEESKLRFAGGVGSGFDEDTLTRLRKLLDTMRTDSCPFAEEPSLDSPATWVKPEVVVEVKFSKWTPDKRLRIPVFLRVRGDKPAAEVRHFEPVNAAGSLPDEPTKPETGAVDEVIEQLNSSKNSIRIDVEGEKITLGNLDKELWPAENGEKAVTKRDFISYLVRVSPYLLPHLKDRPLSLSRYPEGIYGQHFYQKHWRQPLPGFVDTVLLSSHDESASQEYLLCNNLPTLVWLGQIADIEIHTWFSRVAPGEDFKASPRSEASADYYADYPDFIVFDLDPYIYSGKEAPGAEPELNHPAFSKACQIALRLKETLDGLSLPSFVKTTGRTGLHIFVPVLRQLEYKATRSAAETLGRFLLQRFPLEVTVEWAVEKRKGKIFIDYNQNVRGKTLASIYSPRPFSGATVSVPLRWDELGKVYPTDFTIRTVPRRLTEIGDLWADILKDRIDLPALLQKL